MKGVGGAGLLAALSACGSGSSGGGGDLQFWHLLTGPDGATMADLVSEYEKSPEGRTVNQTVLAWGESYYTKLAMASSGGRAPDIAVMHASRIPGYAPGGLLDPFDLDKLSELGIKKDDFPKLIWDKMVVDDKLQCVALDSHPFVMFYNLDIADKAGVLTSDDRLQETNGPDEFRDMLLEMGGKSKSGYGLSWGYLDDPANQWRMFLTWYTQLGGTITLPDGGPMEYQEEIAIDTLEWILSLIDGEVGNPSHDGGTGISEFATGASGSLFNGEWETAGFKESGLDFSVDVIPGALGDPTAYADSHSLVLPHQDNPDPERRSAVYELVAAILKNSLKWAQAGHIPAYTPVVESSEYEHLKPQSNYAWAQKVLTYDPTSYMTGSGSEFQNYVGDHLLGVFSRRTKPLDGWNAFVERVNAQLAKPNPM
jgi:multiple sugar transport system substrate-binding protein